MKRKRTVVIKENYPTGTASRNQTSGELTPYDEPEKFFHSTRDKFLKEAQIIRHLEHPNIVRVYSVFEALGTAYYTMPYLEGAKELWQASPTSDKIDEAWLLPILQKLLGALAYLHDFGVLHRDLKTNNIMLLQDGTPVIIDFGIARSIDAKATTSLQIGTPGFSPPEQGSTKAGFSADLYSLGATCYHLLAGKIPPAAQNRLLGTDPYEPLCNMAELNGRFNQELLSSIDRALRFMPTDRWQSAQEWMAAIDSSSNTTATPVNGTRVPTIAAPAPTPKITQQAAQAELQRRGISAGEYDSKLLEAAINGETELVKLLIAAGTDVNKADNDWGRTPLYRAASEGHTECVKLLIAAGADVNKANKLGKTPLFTAAMNGHTECVKLLLAAGADVNKANKLGETLLYTAARCGHTECAKLLLAAGADVNQTNEDGESETPLYGAASNGRTECVKLLIAAGADVNKADRWGKTPLYMAAWNGRTECVKLLINAGADVNKADKWGTPLSNAAVCGHTECVKLLIAAGADVNKDVNKADEDGQTLLYRAAKNGHTECVKLLIDAGSDVNKADEDGITPLYKAADNGHTECVKQLIAAGADVNKADEDGKTPLYTAKKNGHTECAELLRAAGGNYGGIKGFFKRIFS